MDPFEGTEDLFSVFIPDPSKDKNKSLLTKRKAEDDLTEGNKKQQKIEKNDKEDGGDAFETLEDRM